MSFEQPTNGWRNSPRTYWVGGVLALILVGKLCSLYLSSAALERTKPITERCVIEAGSCKMVAVGVRPGDVLEVFVDVENGDPVDVVFGRDPSSTEKKISFRDSGLPQGKQTKHFQISERWPHDSPAVVIVASANGSEVTIRARIK